MALNLRWGWVEWEGKAVWVCEREREMMILRVSVGVGVGCSEVVVVLARTGLRSEIESDLGFLGPSSRWDCGVGRRDGGA